MPNTYPSPAPTISGDTISISRFLNNPALVERRLRTLLQQRYIADALLTSRLTVSGGAVQYETGESIFTADSPLAVSPGAEYPLTTSPTGTASIAKTSKWGQDQLVTDEAIARQKMDPVNRSMQKLVNQNVKYVDSIALSAISTAVTNSTAATAAFTTATAAQILDDISKAVAAIRALNQGYDPDTVVLDDTRWANAMSKFIQAGIVPRETNTQNPALTGVFPTILGMRWLASPNTTANTVLIVDSTQLGGMADEQLGGPGYSNSGQPGVEAKSIREDLNDRWRLRVRRVTVPIVIEPAAGYKLTSA